MTDIKVGDWVLVPKGTQLQHDDTKGYSNKDAGVTSRDVTVQVCRVEKLQGYHLDKIASPEAVAEYRSIDRMPWGMGHLTEEDFRKAAQENQKRLDDAERKMLESVPGGSTHLIYWTNDRKSALNNDVKVVPAPPPRKVPEPKVNLRQQMVDKSQWKVTRDQDLYVDITNPQLEADLQVWLKANPEPIRPPHTTVMTARGPAILMTRDDAWDKAHGAWWKARRDEIVRIADLYPATVPDLMGSVKAGQIFTIKGKFGTHMSYKGSYLAGSFAPLLFEGATKPTFVPYATIKDVIEPLSIPTVDIYVLRDKDTGLFMHSYPHGNSVYEWDRDDKGEIITHPIHGHRMGGSYVYKGMANSPEMVDKFMKAKHFDSMGRLKTSILQATGYYDGLNTDALDSSRGYDTSYEKQMDLPENWEVVKFDKLARKEMEVLDIQEWYKRAYELRELTLRFGSSVRGVYKDLEKREELNAQKGVLVFTVPEAQKEEGLDYGKNSAFTPEQAKSVTDLIEQLGMKKGSYRTAKDAYTQSLSFKDKGVAMLAKLSYSGTLKISVLDLETLKEAVDG